MTIRFLKKRSFEVQQPRLGYWIEITPLRHFDNEAISFAIAAHELNAEFSSRQSFIISAEFASKKYAERSWRNGFDVTSCEHERVEQLVRELLGSGLAIKVNP